MRQFSRCGVDGFPGQCRYFHRLSDVSQLEFEVHGQPAIGRYVDSCSLLALESRVIYFQCVRADRKVGKNIESACIGLYKTGVLRFRVGDNHSYTGDWGFGLIGDRSTNSAEAGLCGCDGSCEAQ